MSSRHANRRGLDHTSHLAAAGRPAARLRLVLVVLASSVARADRCASGRFDLRGYGGSDKPPRGYDAWTLAGDTAGLIRALGHSSATLIGHADGGLVCWTAALLHARLVRAIALISSPHPAALRTLRADASRSGLRAVANLAALSDAAVAGTPADPHDGAEIEHLVSSRSCAKWVASEDFSETIGHLRTAIQIPGAAHCALEYQRWAVRSQLRGEGHRFIKSMWSNSVCRCCTCAATPTLTCWPTRSITASVMRRRDAIYPSLAQDISAMKRRPRKSTDT